MPWGLTVLLPTVNSLSRAETSAVVVLSAFPWQAPLQRGLALCWEQPLPELHVTTRQIHVYPAPSRPVDLSSPRQRILLPPGIYIDWDGCGVTDTHWPPWKRLFSRSRSTARRRQVPPHPRLPLPPHCIVDMLSHERGRDSPEEGLLLMGSRECSPRVRALLDSFASFGTEIHALPAHP